MTIFGYIMIGIGCAIGLVVLSVAFNLVVLAIMMIGGAIVWVCQLIGNVIAFLSGDKS